MTISIAENENSESISNPDGDECRLILDLRNK